ncbi:MAG TPA: alpha-glucuronidase family glycosyl hydrolase, partial [Chitinophagaceae bacterium]|nr:alpha-glucuronidase family glycosyl hydrolase [Chitinophagaceae bacterium]
MKKQIFATLFIFISIIIHAEDGYRLWLRYDKIDNPGLLQQYKDHISCVQFTATSPTLSVAKGELLNDLGSLLGKIIKDQKTISNNCLVAGTPSSSQVIQAFLSAGNFNLGKEGFVISTKKIDQKNIILIAANSDIGVLYGVFEFLRILQTHKDITHLSITSVPKIQNRILDHWDNLNRSVERGYAGISIWNWHLLPGYIDKRYIDYARANASIGINGVVLNNVNANALVLTKQYLEKVAALAEVFRSYGIKVFLSARFSAPVEIGGLSTADPLDSKVREWWKQKV